MNLLINVISTKRIMCIMQNVHIIKCIKCNMCRIPDVHDGLFTRHIMQGCHYAGITIITKWMMHKMNYSLNRLCKIRQIKFNKLLTLKI